MKDKSSNENSGRNLDFLETGPFGMRQKDFLTAYAIGSLCGIILVSAISIMSPTPSILRDTSIERRPVTEYGIKIQEFLEDNNLYFPYFTF